MSLSSEQAKRLFSRTPLVGPSFECSPSEHWRALTELLAGLFWSMLPIWVGTFVALLKLKGEAFDLQRIHSAFTGTVAGGELFIYAAAFLAPIFWIVHYNPPGGGQFPSSLAHSILTLIITVFAALSFGLQRSGQDLNPTVLHALSVWFFWVAVALIYLATLYDNHRLPTMLPEEIKSQEDKFLNSYRERRR